jgi:hypothetical protein
MDRKSLGEVNFITEQGLEGRAPTTTATRSGLFLGSLHFSSKAYGLE